MNGEGFSERPNSPTTDRRRGLNSRCAKFLITPWASFTRRGRIGACTVFPEQGSTPVTDSSTWTLNKHSLLYFKTYWACSDGQHPWVIVFPNIFRVTTTSESRSSVTVQRTLCTREKDNDHFGNHLTQWSNCSHYMLFNHSSILFLPSPCRREERWLGRAGANCLMMEKRTSRWVTLLTSGI